MAAAGGCATQKLDAAAGRLPERERKGGASHRSEGSKRTMKGEEGEGVLKELNTRLKKRETDHRRDKSGEPQPREGKEGATNSRNSPVTSFHAGREKRDSRGKRSAGWDV